jgi:hypothetical protein
MTKLNELPPPPLVLPVDVARDLADAAWTVPCQVLHAVREVVHDTISRTEADVRDWPRRRGNGAKRAQVDRDYTRITDIREELTARSCCSFGGREDDCIMGAVPDLGPAQWKLVAAYARTRATPSELFTVVQGVMPDDEPLDWTSWQAWSRRRHWTFAALSARITAPYRHEEADRAEEDAQRLMRQAADRQLRAIEARAEARRLEAAAEPHRQALELDDPGLAVYEAAIHAGMPPAAALQRAGRSSN